MNAPNLITLFRILLAPVFLVALISSDTDQARYLPIAFVIFVLASLSDAVDGLVARLSRNKTRLGQFLDPFADKVLLLTGYLGILFVPSLIFRPPLWITVVIVFRDGIIILGLLMIYMASGTIEMLRPNALGKLTTFFQMTTLALILLQWPGTHYFWNVTAGLTLLSGIVYIVRDFNKLS
ncbi:MAG: hypothetical protein A2Z83_05445 [Omnitrophica bacterium GWA2_52_8]|nr:MAG: hypothetical protein A2Z83_05445 [Omnitrophica bacterium GWA2_52_8]